MIRIPHLADLLYLNHTHNDYELASIALRGFISGGSRILLTAGGQEEHLPQGLLMGEAAGTQGVVQGEIA